MAETTIEWTSGPRGEQGYTFNGWIGCTKVSPGCDNCYAAAQDKFRSWTPEGWGAGKPRRRTSEANWRNPQRWNEASRAAGERRKVFCSSLADVFDNEVPPIWRVELLAKIAATENLDWLLLTKRVGNVERLLIQAAELAKESGMAAVAQWIFDWVMYERPPANVWLGATIVNQEEADRDIPKLLATPARVRFLSMEPLLGPVDLGNIPISGHGHHEFDPIITANVLKRATAYPPLPQVHWVITGFESGPNARPGNPQWARDIGAQCTAAGVPWLHKQNGEWVSVSEVGGGKRHHYFPDGATVRLVGKKAAGRLLDGVEHNGFPESRHE